MKIVTFWGGLGNQIIDYAYYQWLKDKFPNEKFYAFYPKAGLRRHNGLEIDKRFDIKMPATSIITNVIAYILFYAIKILKLLRLPYPFTSTYSNRKDDAIFHCDDWQDISLMPKNFKIEFRKFKINNENSALLKIIEHENSVAIHIRRGDYLEPKTKAFYGGICTDNYYMKSINWIKKNVKDPYFIFFSNDSDYVSCKYHYDNMTIVNWNIKSDSYIDMYLMSRCKYMILANSTFSYWAARFNNDALKIICPTKWNNDSHPPKLTIDGWMEVEP